MTRQRGRALPGNRWDLLDGVVPTRPPSVTAVVAHYRQQAQLDRTLAALGRQDHEGPLEIVVVDDGSPEPPIVPDGVRLVCQDDRGFRLAAARNAGAGVATGEVLCFLDADTAPEPAYVRELTRMPALAPDVVTVGRRRHADFTSVDPGEAVATAGLQAELEEPRWLRDSYERSGNLLEADDRSYRFVIGAVTACSAVFFAETGGYDESFTRYGGEDWEWAYRAWLNGAVLAHVPDAVAWHDGPDWAGRSSAERQAAKNQEMLTLADRIPVPGSAGRGLRGRYADVVVQASGSLDRAEWFVSLDSITSDLPLVALDDDPRLRDRVRIEISVERPTRIRPGVLRRVLEEFDQAALGDLTLEGDDHRPLLRITAARAAARRARWRDDELFPSRVLRVPGVEAIPAEPDVEGYVGGWS